MASNFKGYNLPHPVLSRTSIYLSQWLCHCHNDSRGLLLCYIIVNSRHGRVP